MKKKLLCMLLVLCTLLTLFPVIASANEAGEVQVPSYDDLYVKDGLFIWLDAYDNTSANTNLDLAGGKWYSRLGDGIYATIGGGVYSDSKPMGWKAGANGGIGWSQHDGYSQVNTGLFFDTALIPDGDFTVEIMATTEGITTEDGERFVATFDTVTQQGNRYGRGHGESIAIGTFRNYSYICLLEVDGSQTKTTDYLGYRWYLSGMVYGNHNTNYSGKDIAVLTEEKTMKNEYGPFDPYILSMSLRWDSREQVNMRVAYDNTHVFSKDVTGADMKLSGVLPQNNAGYDAAGTPTESNVKFQLQSGMAGNIWNVRIYRRALTEAEIWQNQFADMARFYELDLTTYATMDAEMKAYVHELVGKLGFTSDTATVQEAVANAKTAYEEEQARLEQERLEREARLEELKNRPNTDKYYVQDGLIIWLDGFTAFPELNKSIDLAEGKWYSKLGDGVYATIGGAEKWEVSKNGQGIGYRLTKAEYKSSLKNNKCIYGIEFDPALLPESNYTIETVATLVGLTNPDGTRYVDPSDSPDTWGIYTSGYSTFSFGPFKAMTFLCTSHASKGTPIGHRWCYTKKEWGEHNGSDGYTDDRSLADMDGVTPVAYDISRRHRNSEVDIYTVRVNDQTVYALQTPFIIYDTEPEFNLFKGLASTVYTIRVYNKELTAAEQAQNHVADLITYYGLDTELFDLVLDVVADKAEFYALFNDMGFGYATLAEAQKAFISRLAGAWLKGMGLSFRLDNTAAVRGVFQLNEAAIDALEATGYKVEAGVLLNVGGDVLPTLGEAGYQVIFRANDGTVNHAFCIDEDEGLMALTVNLVSPTPTMAITSLRYNGYVTLTDANGETMTLYVACEAAAFDSNMFAGYEYLSQTEDYESNKFVKKVVNEAYTNYTIYLDAEAGDDENDGGVETPVETIERAYELLLELLQLEAPVDVTLSFGEGKYFASQVELSKDDYTQKYVRLHFEGVAEDEEDDSTFKTVISGNQEFDGAGFEPVEGKPYYKYQFTADDEGAYPDFRLFYVNGIAQEVAHHGYNRTYEAETVGGSIDAMWKVTEIFEGVDKDHTSTANPDYKFYLPAEAFLDEEGNLIITEEDLYKLEFHTPVAWYYRMMHIDNIDVEDTDGKGNIAVFIRPEDAKRWSAQHLIKNHYFWLENALSFVDEPGEFYYNDAEGTLYYYPAEGVDMENATFEIPQTENLFGFDRVNNLDFKYLVFTGCDNNVFGEGGYMGGQASTAIGTHFGQNYSESRSALFILNSKNVNIYSCIFQEVGADAVKFYGTTRNLTIDTCRFYHIGSTAIHVGKHDGTWNEESNANENLLITNNYLNDIAFMTRGSVACYVSVAKNYELSYNTIMNTSYSAVSLGWRWAPVEWEFGTQWHVYNAELCYNYFRDFMTDQSDGGAIYTLGGNVSNNYTEKFNYLHDNFAWFTDKTWDGQGMVMPYYHDGASSNWYTHDNAEILHPFRKVHTTIYLQNIPEQHTHNIMVESNHIVAAYQNATQYVEKIELTPEELEIAIFGIDNYLVEGNYKPSRVDAERGLEQYENHVYKSMDDMSSIMWDIAEVSGSFLMPPDMDEIYDTVQPLYEAYYELLEEEYAYNKLNPNG